MIRVLILITKEQYIWLKQKSDTEDVPVTGIVRQLITAAMTPEEPPEGVHG